jgi:orotate phosphoribosyltransferase
MELNERLERARQRVVLALDVDTLDKALDLVSRLHPYVGMFKVGLELLTAEGAPQVVKAIKEAGGEIFFDGKFDDIGNTIGAATKAATKHGVKIINLHASATMPAMLEAVKNKGRAKIYAVTVLTSIDEHNSNIVFGGPTKAKVLQMAREAKLAGCDGIICSPQELEMLGLCPELSSLKKMTPGIRPAFSQVNDQKRIMTPAEAIKAGAHYLVIGRPITKPDGMTPEEAALKVLEEIAEVLDNETKTRESEIMKIFEDSKAIITGSHIVYTSGKHGEAYVNKDAVYPHTAKVSRLCQFIAEDFENEEIDTVVGPVVGGVSLSQWTAHHLSALQGKEILAVSADKIEILSGKQVIEQMCRFMRIESWNSFLGEDSKREIEKVPGSTEFVIKRGQDKFITGKKILVVEDILTTGGSVKKVVEIVKEMGGEIIGVGALCNRGGVIPEQIGEIPVLKALVNVNLDAYDEADCPYCKSGIPINTSVGKGAEYLKKKQQK